VGFCVGWGGGVELPVPPWPPPAVLFGGFCEGATWVTSGAVSEPTGVFVVPLAAGLFAGVVPVGDGPTGAGRPPE
jgi:hypothetical protein